MPLNGLTNGDTSFQNHTAQGLDSPPISSIYEASSVAEIRAALASLHTHETNITSRLRSLISSQADLSRELGRLDLLRAHLGTQVVNTRAISNDMLDSAASTAQSLSGKVKELDFEKKRVEETLGVVEQVAELKACVQGVVGSMGAPQDWEAAAGYIARASRIPDSITKGAFASRIVPSVEVPDAPSITLENAKESLCGLFLREFEKAQEAGDGAKITRFFKLFPLISRTDVGLDVYGKYVCQGVATRARSNLSGQSRDDIYFYANALTKLFEHIVILIDGHGGLVERHYGSGKMVKVIERLQLEANVQGGIILDTWHDERNVDRRLTDVKSYPFSFLVQSFMQNPVQRGFVGTPRTGSPAINGSTNGRVSEDEGVDLKEIDGLLAETSKMLSRWSLYCRFLSRNCRDPDLSPDTPLSAPVFLLKAPLSQKISSRVITPFNVMTTFYFRRSVELAFQTDESPSGLSLNLAKQLDGNRPYIISAVDTVMYIADKELQRSLSTSQRDVIASVVPTIGRVLGSEFVGMIQRKMRDECYPKPAVQGGFPPENKIIDFIVLINSLHVANEYLERVVTARQSDNESGISIETLFPFHHDAVFVTNCLSSLNTTFASKTSELIADALNAMFANVVKPRLRPVLRDTFRDVDYSLTDEELAEIVLQEGAEEEEDIDFVSHRFVDSWNRLMKPLARIMEDKRFAELLDQTARDLAKVLERRIWSMSGKVIASGAVRMERDFSAIIAEVARGGRYEIRRIFARVTQILLVVNMEEDEWEELNESELEDGVEWVLSKEERVRARGIVR